MAQRIRLSRLLLVTSLAPACHSAVDSDGFTADDAAWCDTHGFNGGILAYPLQQHPTRPELAQRCVERWYRVLGRLRENKAKNSRPVAPEDLTK